MSGFERATRIWASPLGKSGRPQRFQQAWLFENARLAHSGFAEWVKPSHGPVHLNSITVARGVVLDGHSPAGYDTYVVVQVAWQALCSFYELAVQASLLACGPALDIQRALSWSELLYERVGAALRTSREYASGLVARVASCAPAPWLAEADLVVPRG